MIEQMKVGELKELARKIKGENIFIPSMSQALLMRADDYHLLVIASDPLAKTPTWQALYEAAIRLIWLEPGSFISTAKKATFKVEENEEIAVALRDKAVLMALVMR